MAVIIYLVFQQCCVGAGWASRTNLIDPIVSKSTHRAWVRLILQSEKEKRKERKTPIGVIEQVRGAAKNGSSSVVRLSLSLLLSLTKWALGLPHNLPVVQSSFAQQLFVKRWLFVSLLLCVCFSSHTQFRRKRTTSLRWAAVNCLSRSLLHWQTHSSL